MHTRRAACVVSVLLMSPMSSTGFPHAAAGFESPQHAAVTGRGRVFAPNAVAATGDTSLRDQDDAASAIPDSAYTQVNLPELDGSGYLTGTWVSTELTPDRVRVPSLDFSALNRQDDGFEEVEIYWAITAAQQYIHDTLGIAGAGDYQIQVNAHALSEDQSYFDEASRTGRIRFGDGGVDDGEDAELVWQMYGYAVMHHQRGGMTTPQGVAMRVGFGFYFAAAMSTLFAGDSRFFPTTAEWDAVAYSTGDAQHPWPHLFLVDNGHRFPDDLSARDPDPDPYHDAQIWAAALWDLQKALGRDTATRIIINSHFLQPPDVDFASGAEAILESDRRLNGGGNAGAITAAFAARGIEAGAARVLEVTAVVPGEIAVGTGVPVRIVGDRFAPGARVSVGRGVSVSEITVVSPTEIHAKLTAAAGARPGPRRIQVRNPDGSKAKKKKALQVK